MGSGMLRGCGVLEEGKDPTRAMRRARATKASTLASAAARVFASRCIARIRLHLSATPILWNAVSALGVSGATHDATMRLGGVKLARYVERRSSQCASSHSWDPRVG